MPYYEMKIENMEVIKMMVFMISLGLTLVISSLVTAVLTIYGMCKLMTNEKFVKGYFKWFTNTMKIMEKSMEELEDEIEL